MNINRINAWACFFLFIWFFSGASYGHGTGNNEDTHQYQDAYIAAMVREEEARGTVVLQQYLSNLMSSVPVNALLTELVSAVVGEKVNAAVGGNAALYGQWGPLKTWPFAFASATNLPDGRILAWGGNNPRSFNGGTFTYAAVWDPVTGQITNVNHPTHSMFCGVPVMLEDGRILVNGGDHNNTSSVKSTSTFDYMTQTWTRIQDMAVGRWYPGTVALPNGQVFTAVGDPGSAYPEIWTPGTGWSYLNGASLQTAIIDYPTLTEPKNWLPHLHLAPNGEIFHSGHTPQMHYIDPAGNGSVTPVALTNGWNTANTPSVLIDEGKLLKAGGALYATNNPSTTKSAVIDLNSGVPSQAPTADMHFPRIFHNLVVMANGETIALGGNTTGLKFDDAGSQLTPEIYNPTTQTWRQVADIAVPRNYHSVALLMTDGRVWSGGGGLCNCSADHQDSQVYSPPYLFNPDGSLATRPEIADAPNVVSNGQAINVAASPGISKFNMVRMSATTHALNSDMRFLNVPFVVENNGNYVLNLHTNRNVMTPGYWMLFAMDGQGVPSVAKIVKVSTSDTPVILNPGDQSTLINTSVALNLQANDPNGDPLTFNAIALPQGLNINATSGSISGIPTSVGSSRVVISVTDGVNTATVSFEWNIVSNQPPPVASAVFGGSGGTAFTDSVAANQFLRWINIRSGGSIDSIQGITNTGPLAQHGGTGGTLKNAVWPADEYLVRIYGVYGTYIGKISFVTNTGRVLGPYGTAGFYGGGSNPKSYDYTVPANQEIVGFTGRASSFINAIGVLYRPRQIINQPPLVTTIANQVHNVGETVNLAVIASDPDGDALSYSAIGLPPGLNIAANTGLISGSPTTSGNYDVIVTVQDARGATSALNFIWSVNLPALVFNPITTSPQPVNTPVSLTASVTNGTNPRYKWSFGDGTPETAYSSTAAITHNFTAPGLYVVRVTVTDNSGATNTETFTQAIYLPHTANRPTQSGNMAISTNRLWVVNQDNDTVSVFNTSTNAKLAEVIVGKSPRAIAIAPDGRVWVSNKGAATISIINPTTLQVVQTVNLPPASQPFGLAFAPNGGAAYVALEATGKLLKLNPSSGATIASLDIGPNPRHISITSDDSKALVTRFITPPLSGESTATVNTTNGGGEVVVVNAGTMTINKTVVLQHSNIQDSENQGSGVPNYLAMAAISPDGISAWVPSKKDNIKRGTFRNGNNPNFNLNFQNTVRAISSKIDLATLNENNAARIDFDNSSVSTAAAFDLSGNYLAVTLSTSREVAIVNAYGGIVLSRIQVGRAPDGLAVSADGKKLYVNNFMDRTVSVVDLTKLLSQGDSMPPIIATLAAVATEKLSPTVLTGKKLFYDAKDLRLASDGYLSCAACHNDGGHDGRVLDLTGFGEGLRNTIDLRGRGGMSQGPLHWTGNFDEVQDFEGQIRNLAGGTGLMSDVDFAATESTLGTPKAGKSADLDALAAYVASLNTFTTSPYLNADGSLTSSALAGKTLFNNTCVQCHGGIHFTDSASGLLHNVGTIKASSGKRLNATLTGLDTPTLRDAWNTAPYLHDGSAPTLNDAIRAHIIVSLSDAEIAQVAAYVQQIGGSEPAPANTPPSVAMTAPANASSYLQGTAINLAANASDNDGSVAKVEFYVGNALLGSDTSSPYNFSWAGATVGNHTLTAKAYDNYGAVSTSSGIGVTVQVNGATGSGLLGQYFNSIDLTGTPVLQRTEAVDFAWSTGSPGLGVTTNYFSVRWTGQVEAPVTGTYQFQTVSDDGVRLTVNGTQLINNWTPHSPTTDTSTDIALVAGTKYQAVMEYFERRGSATAKLLWKTPGQTAFVAIPANRLFNQ